MPGIGDSRVSAGTGAMKFSTRSAASTSVDVVNSAQVVSESILASKIASLEEQITLLSAKLTGLADVAKLLKDRVEALEDANVVLEERLDDLDA